MLSLMLPPIEFRRISCVETTKEVWDTLETTHKGTKAEKNSKLQMLTTRFYAKLNDTINSKFNLRENVDEPKIERKVLRSLPQSFRPKVTIIGESRDVDTKKIKELVGLIQTYELTLPSHKKSMSTALKAIEEVENDSSDEDDIEQDVVFLAKNFISYSN